MTISNQLFLWFSSFGFNCDLNSQHQVSSLFQFLDLIIILAANVTDYLANGLDYKSQNLNNQKNKSICIK